MSSGSRREELELGSFIPQAAITWAGPNALKQQAIVLDFPCDGRYQDGSRFEMGDYSGWWLVTVAGESCGCGAKIP